MKIVIVGGTGTIGKAVAKELGQRHRIIVATSHGEHKVDMTSVQSIEKMYQSISDIDAIIITAGKISFKPLAVITPEDYQIGFDNKLMGQVNMVLIGQRYLKENGSFTLTSGRLSDDPVRSGSNGSVVNAAINSFVKAAAIELPKGMRINAVSPTIIEESKHHYEAFFRGFEPVPAARVALAYSKSVEGAQTGRVYPVG
jgi:NAD(P)-dependent dehydrogenase (short-subunit alcohol dehydrogenase family)